AAGLAEDHRVDADDLSLQVEKRPSRVAGVDRDVGLDEWHPGADRAGGRADDAGGDAVLEPERRTDSQHPLARLQGFRVADAYRRKVACIDLDDRNIGAGVDADDLRLEFPPVRQADRYLVC